MNCNKAPFESMEVANLRAGEINSENAKYYKTFKSLRPYKCRSCGKIHLTSKTKSEYLTKRKRTKEFLRSESEYWESKLGSTT